MFSIELKILISFAWALIVFLVVALIIGPERKAQWFQRRKSIPSLIDEVLLVNTYFSVILRLRKVFL